ncbi:MAG: 2Fe-2S iron-sulfur cluster binding domain-containing protein [Armatimonadetes bacterium]|nr:2Fe-2S iron-sulfur cluster binding domain-containing protein [Armatimonadota bacterium]MDE2206955.1 2Fe-2S iron-sulfur cluster binding domain-containing protein [Armatimonadota bacterium]
MFKERRILQSVRGSRSVPISAGTLRKLVCGGSDAITVFSITFILPDGSEAHTRAASSSFLLDAAEDAGLELPYMCRQGWCITCAGHVEGAGSWDQSASRRYFDQDRDAGFILLCTAQPRSDLTIRTGARLEMRDHRVAHKLPTPMR